MTMSDPIADMLTRIRNANTAKHDTVDVPASKMKISIADILADEGYIEKYELQDDGKFKTIHITLKYGANKNEKVISGLQRISKPGLRVYASCEDLPKVLGGLGTAIISTNQGVVTDKEARKKLSQLLSIVNMLDSMAVDVYDAIPSEVSDFEDAVMIETAKRSKMDCIVTRNQKDYTKSSVTVYAPEKFIEILEQSE